MTSLAPVASSRLLRDAPEILALVAAAALVLRGPVSWPEGALLADLPLGLALLLASAQSRIAAPRGPVLALFLGLIAASALVAADAGAAAGFALHALRLLSGFWLGCTIVARESGAGRAAWTLAAAGALAAVHGAAQVAFLHPRLAASHPEAGAGALAQLTDGRANSVFMLPAHLGSLEAAALTASVGLLMAHSGARRLVAAAFAALAVAGLALAGSLGGILLAAGGIALLTLMLAAPRSRRRMLVATGVLGIALAIFSLQRRQEDVQRESPWTARARNWAVAASLIREAPLLGHGPGSFGVEHARSRPAASNDVRHAHQLVLEAASDLGVLVLPLLAAFLGVLAARVAGRAPDPQRSGIIAAAGVLIAESAIDFGWLTPEWGIPAACIVGVAWSGGRRERLGTFATGLAAGVLAVVAAWDLASAISRSASEDALELARAGRHAEARSLLQVSARLAPLDDRRWSELASSELALAAAASEPERSALLSAALAHARKAVRCSPRKAARHALVADVLAASGDRVGAAVAAVRAAELAPHAPWSDHSADRLRDAGLLP